MSSECVVDSVLQLNSRSLRALQMRQCDKAMSIWNDAIRITRGIEGPLEQITAEIDEHEQEMCPYYFEDYNDGRLIYSVPVEPDATMEVDFEVAPQRAGPREADCVFCRGLHGSLNLLCSMYSMESIQNLLLGILFYNYGLMHLLMAEQQPVPVYHHGLAIEEWEESIVLLSCQTFCCLPMCACLYNLAYVHSRHESWEYARHCYNELTLWIQDDKHGMLTDNEIAKFRQTCALP